MRSSAPASGEEMKGDTRCSVCPSSGLSAPAAASPRYALGGDGRSCTGERIQRPHYDADAFGALAGHEPESL